MIPGRPTTRAERLGPAFSVLTSTTGYAASNTSGSPALISQYCNGSRVPPEVGGLGWEVPPGTNETNALPTPVFSLTPSATVDEGNNWINLRWGPLALAKPANNAVLGNYGLTSTSSAINRTPSSAGDAYNLAPSLDYFGNQRKANNAVDAGAVEFAGTGGGGGGAGTVSISPNPLTITLSTGTITGTGVVTLTNTTAAGGSSVTVSNVGVSGGSLLTYFFTVGPLAGPNTCTGATLAPGASCTVTVRFTNVLSARGSIVRAPLPSRIPRPGSAGRSSCGSRELVICI